MSLRIKLYILTFVLSAMTLAFVVVRASEALEERNAVVQARQINAIADRYLAAAAGWAVEPNAPARPRATTPATMKPLACMGETPSGAGRGAPLIFT
jgi:hypothetical protein